MKHIDTNALLSAIAGFCIILLFTHHGGIGVSPDSVVYTSVARNIYHHHQLEAYNHMPLVDFPVFYPVFLSVSMFVSGLDPVVSGPVLNGLLFGLLIYLCGVAFRKSSSSVTARWALYLSLIISPALLNVYTMLWSETLFIVLSMVLLLLTHKYCQKTSLTVLIGMAVCAGLACITRYAGITLIATGGFIILFRLNTPLRKRIGHTLLFGCLSSAFLLANLLRNAQITGTFTGEREKGITPFFTNMYYYGTVLCDWLSFLKGHYQGATLLAIASLLLSAILLIRHLFRPVSHGAMHNIALAFFFIYTLFIVVSSTISRYEQINNRLLSPAFAPLLLVVIYSLSTLPERFSHIRKTYLLVPLALMFILFQASQVQISKSMYNEYNHYGIPGYTQDSWRHSPVTQHIQNHPNLFKPGTTIYSNAQEAVYFTTGLAAKSLPHTIDTQDVETFAKTNEHYLIRYNEVNDTDLVSMPFITAHKKLTPLYTATDGVIYSCTLQKANNSEHDHP
ncbi:glycosyltransferase family protein [Filimonas effusa]|uniref:Uncharacterized protein n=1 Tax=Filimonas effusa TaxID=2508721 RepID=A0A4Q1DD23_9BACT|nr:glycosyltransferase family 39 protein [Filimonas effusa]RXK86878.1 hypothetical protein ESB13_08840 [Filimonas effusa]